MRGRCEMWSQPESKQGVGRSGASLEAISPVLAEYAEALGVPVRLEVPRGLVVRPRGRRGWWLHPFALPGRPGWLGLGPQVRPMMLPVVCGFPLPPDRRSAWRVPARDGWGRPLRDLDGQTIGLLRETDVYILFDLLGQEPKLACLLARTVLDLSLEAGRLLLPILTGLGPATLEARLRQLRQTTEVEAFRASAAWRADRPEQGEASGGEFESLSNQLRELERDLRTSGRQMHSLERRLTQAERRLADLGCLQASAEALTRDFDRLVGLPGVVDVEVKDGVLRVLTDTIVVTYGSRRYRMGRFRLDLHFDGRVFLRNLTNRYETYDHPHVESGRPCLGNIQEWVQRLLAQGRDVLDGGPGVTFPFPPRGIRILGHALDKLLLYAERCPVEIGGLGTVIEDAHGLVITDLVLLAQKASASDTE